MERDKKDLSDKQFVNAVASLTNQTPKQKKEFREGLKFVNEGIKDNENAVESIEALGAYLRSLRSERNVSLYDVERATGISNAYLSLLERGFKQHLPRPEILGKLANYYNVSMKELLQHAGYLKDVDIKETMQDRIETAFQHVIRDPKYRVSTLLHSGQLNLEAKRFIVEIYERATGRSLLKREQRPDRILEPGEGGWLIKDVKRHLTREGGEQIVRYDCFLRYERSTEEASAFRKNKKVGTNRRKSAKWAEAKGSYSYPYEYGIDETFVLQRAFEEAREAAYKKLTGLSWKAEDMANRMG